MSRWTKKHSRCRGCGTTEKAHRGQGYCTTCHPRAMADGRIRVVKPRVLRRVRLGRVEYRCTNCELWKGEREFYRREGGGVHGNCIECRNRKSRRHAQKPHVKRRRREQDLEKRRLELEALALSEPPPPGQLDERGNVPAHLLQPVIDQIALGIPDDAPRQQTLADMCRVSTRLIYDVERGLRGVRVESAETILLAAGMSLTDIIGEPGVEGWSKHSRYCLRCGTTRRRHRAKGYCTRCYTSAWRELRKYGVVRPPHEERWSFKHDVCRRCRRTDSPHERRGLCARCVRRCERMAKVLGVPAMQYMDALGYTRDFLTGKAINRV